MQNATTPLGRNARKPTANRQLSPLLTSPVVDRSSADFLAGNDRPTALDSVTVNSARKKKKKKKKKPEPTRNSSEVPFPDDPFDAALQVAATRNPSALTTPKPVTKKQAMPLQDETSAMTFDMASLLKLQE